MGGAVRSTDPVESAFCLAPIIPRPVEALEICKMSTGIRARSGRVALSMLLGLTFLATAAKPASAQFGDQAGFTEVFRPDFYRRDMQLYADYLRLEEWQRPIVEILLDDYQVSFDLGTKECRDRMSRLKDELQADPENAMKIALRPIRQWEAEKRELKRLLIADIQGQLSPLQIQRWPSLERAMRREKELPQGNLPGESMNIFVAIQELDLTPADEQAIDPILLEYEIAIDQALARRRETMDKYQEVLKDAMISKDTDSGLNALRKIGVMRSEVCAHHMQVIDELISVLPEESSISFRRSVLASGFPTVFEETRVDRLLVSVRKLKDLTPDQADQIDAIEARYEIDLTTANVLLIDAYKAYGAEIPILEAKRAIARRNKETVRVQKLPDAIIALQDEKNQMVEDYRQQILGVLNKEQAAVVPMSMNNVRQNQNRATPSSRSNIGGKRSKPGQPSGPTIDLPPSGKGGVERQQKPARELPVGGNTLPQSQNPSQ